MPSSSSSPFTDFSPLTGVIAIVGCDGTGKSRLASDLLSLLESSGPAEKRYLGLVSGESGDKIKNLPVLGVWLESYLAGKAHRAQDMKRKEPGTMTAVIMHLLSWWRMGQLRKVMRLSKSGVRVIVDRFPQAEIPGFRYDGPAFATSPNHGWFMRRLVAQEWRLQRWMAEQRPALIIRLHIDAETAHARKPDHQLEELSDKSSIMPRLLFNGSRICEVDARLPYEDVLAAATAAVKSVLSAD